MSCNAGGAKLYYSDEVIEEVRSRTDIVGYISSYINLKKQGANYVGLCPFHNEKTPSFSVSPSKQMYYCFGCGAGGSVFTFAMEYDNLTFPEAVNMLANRCGMALPDADESEEAKKQQNLRSRLFSINSEAGVYYYMLGRSEAGRIAYDYFIKRGLTDETIKKFALGYSGKSGSLYRYLNKKGYSDEELKQVGLFTFDEAKGVRDKFWNRVMFPIMDVNNRVIAFGGRVMGDAMPKYLNSPETPVFDKSRNLYGLNYARHARTKYFILCEGYMDVIALHQAGFICACASLGTALTGLQANLIKRYVSQVIISYDSDTAGIKAALRAIPILKNAGLSVKILNMEPYKDPDEFIKNLGKDEYQKRIDEAQGSFAFEISVLEKNYDFSDPEQKTEFYNEMAKKLLVFEDELERDNYIEALAARYGIRTHDIKKLVAKKSADMAGITINPVKSSKNVRDKKEETSGQAEGLLLTWITNEPDICGKIRPFLCVDDFYEEPYHSIAKDLFEQYDNTGAIMPAAILNRFENAYEQKTAAGILNRRLPNENLDIHKKQKALNELVKRIKKQNIDRLARSATKPEELQKLMNMMVDLQKLHISL